MRGTQQRWRERQSQRQKVRCREKNICKRVAKMENRTQSQSGERGEGERDEGKTDAGERSGWERDGQEGCGSEREGEERQNETEICTQRLE